MLHVDQVQIESIDGLFIGDFNATVSIQKAEVVVVAGSEDEGVHFSKRDLFAYLLKVHFIPVYSSNASVLLSEVVGQIGEIGAKVVYKDDIFADLGQLQSVVVARRWAPGVSSQKRELSGLI